MSDASASSLPPSTPSVPEMELTHVPSATRKAFEHSQSSKGHSVSRRYQTPAQAASGAHTSSVVKPILIAVVALGLITIEALLLGHVISNEIPPGVLITALVVTGLVLIRADLIGKRIKSNLQARQKQDNVQRHTVQTTRRREATRTASRVSNHLAPMLELFEIPPGLQPQRARRSFERSDKEAERSHTAGSVTIEISASSQSPLLSTPPVSTPPTPSTPKEGPKEPPSPSALDNHEVVVIKVNPPSDDVKGRAEGMQTVEADRKQITIEPVETVKRRPKKTVRWRDAAEIVPPATSAATSIAATAASSTATMATTRPLSLPERVELSRQALVSAEHSNDISQLKRALEDAYALQGEVRQDIVNLSNQFAREEAESSLKEKELDALVSTHQKELDRVIAEKMAITKPIADPYKTASEKVVELAAPEEEALHNAIDAIKKRLIDGEKTDVLLKEVHELQHKIHAFAAKVPGAHIYDVAEVLQERIEILLENIFKKAAQVPLLKASDLFEDEDKLIEAELKETIALAASNPKAAESALDDVADMYSDKLLIMEERIVVLTKILNEAQMQLSQSTAAAQKPDNITQQEDNRRRLLKESIETRKLLAALHKKLDPLVKQVDKALTPILDALAVRYDDIIKRMSSIEQAGKEKSSVNALETLEQIRDDVHGLISEIKKWFLLIPETDKSRRSFCLALLNRARHMQHTIFQSELNIAIAANDRMQLKRLIGDANEYYGTLFTRQTTLTGQMELLEQIKIAMDEEAKKADEEDFISQLKIVNDAREVVSLIQATAAEKMDADQLFEAAAIPVKGSLDRASRVLTDLLVQQKRKLDRRLMDLEPFIEQAKTERAFTEIQTSLNIAEEMFNEWSSLAPVQNGVADLRKELSAVTLKFLQRAMGFALDARKPLLLQSTLRSATRLLDMLEKEAKESQVAASVVQDSITVLKTQVATPKKTTVFDKSRENLPRQLQRLTRSEREAAAMLKDAHDKLDKMILDGQKMLKLTELPKAESPSITSIASAAQTVATTAASVLSHIQSDTKTATQHKFFTASDLAEWEEMLIGTGELETLRDANTIMLNIPADLAEAAQQGLEDLISAAARKRQVLESLIAGLETLKAPIAAIRKQIGELEVLGNEAARIKSAMAKCQAAMDATTDPLRLNTIQLQVTLMQQTITNSPFKEQLALVCKPFLNKASALLK